MKTGQPDHESAFDLGMGRGQPQSRGRGPHVPLSLRAGPRRRRRRTGPRVLSSLVPPCLRLDTPAHSIQVPPCPPQHL